MGGAVPHVACTHDRGKCFVDTEYAYLVKMSPQPEAVRTGMHHKYSMEAGGPTERVAATLLPAMLLPLQSKQSPHQHMLNVFQVIRPIQTVFPARFWSETLTLRANQT